MEIFPCMHTRISTHGYVNRSFTRYTCGMPSNGNLPLYAAATVVITRRPETTMPDETTVKMYFSRIEQDPDISKRDRCLSDIENRFGLGFRANDPQERVADDSLALPADNSHRSLTAFVPPNLSPLTSYSRPGSGFVPLRNLRLFAKQ